VTFPATLPLAGAAFAAMLQLSLVCERWPLAGIGRIKSGIAALALSWAIGAGAYFLLASLSYLPASQRAAAGLHNPGGPIATPDFAAALIVVGVWQAVFFIALHGWPVSTITRRPLRLLAGNSLVIGLGTLTYLTLRDLAHWAPDAISAACGCIIGAVLVVAMLFDGWPAALLRPGPSRALTLVLTALAALALNRALAAYADSVHWTRATPDDWITTAALSFAGAGIILHTGIGLRWPFTPKTTMLDKKPPELALRVTDYLVTVHRGAPDERGAVGGLTQRAAGQDLGFADPHLLVFVYSRDVRREIRREGSRQNHCRFGFAEPGQRRGGDLERHAEQQSVSIGVLPRHGFLQRGQRSGQVAGLGPDEASPRQGAVEHGIEGSGAGQGHAVLDEHERGLRVAGPYRARGGTEGKCRQRRVLDPPGYLDRFHCGRPRRRVVSGGGPGHRFHRQQVCDEGLDAQFRGFLAGFPGDAGPAFWLPGQRPGLGEHHSQQPAADRIA